MSNIGALSVSIEGDNTSLNRALTDSQSRMDRFGSMAARVALSVAKIGAAAAGAAAALGIATVRNVANAADEMAKLSQRTGVAVEDLGRLSHAANLSGVSQGELTTSLTRLSRAMQDASNGTGTATQAFSRLGVSVTDAEGNLRSQADVMSDVADRFARMEDGATKTALAQEIFGRSGANLIPMLNQGSQGLKQMGDEAERLGLVFDEKTTKAAEQLNDNLTRLRGAVQGAAREFSGPIIGALARFTDGMYESYLQSQDLYNEIGKTDNIMRAMNAFKGLGDVISRALDNWTAFFFASPQQQYNKLLQERIALEDKILNIERDEKAKGNDEVGATNQRRIDRYKEEIEAIRQQMAVMAEMQANRQKMESRQAAMMDPLVILGIPEPEVVRERLEQINEIVAVNHEASLQRLREFGMSESELEMERHKQRMTALAEAFFDEAITHEDQHAMLERLQEEHANRMTRITEREAQNRSNIERRVQQDITNMRNAAFSAGVGLLQAFGSESKVAALAAIALNKGLMIAQVIQNTAAAQMRALAELGPIAGPPAAAKIGMYGRLQAGIIAATGLMQAASAGGGNAATASGVTMSSVASSTGMATTGGGMASGSMDRPRTPATATINIVGESFTRSQVAQLIDAINDLTADGARLVIA
jgi:hypothetical protein